METVIGKVRSNSMIAVHLTRKEVTWMLDRMVGDVLKSEVAGEVYEAFSCVKNEMYEITGG